MALSNFPPTSNSTRSAAVKMLFFQLAEDLGDIFAGKTGKQRNVCYGVGEVGHGVGECSEAG
jgi:hypothetical protein